MVNELASLFSLDKTHIQPAAAVLARAFQSYPLLKYYFPDSSRSSRVNHYMCAISLHFGAYFGEVYASSPNLESIAAWLPSKHYPMSAWSVLRAVPLSDLFGFAASGGIKMRAMGRYVDNLHKRLAPFDHWYLSLLGTDPQFQGKGYASKLVRPMLRRADLEKLPCYLETNLEANVSIYCHFGFRVLEESVIPDTAIKNWAMIRDVGGSA